MSEQVYAGKNYDGEYLISKATEAAIKAAVDAARGCRVPRGEPCRYCDELVDKALEVVAGNLYGVAG